MQVFQRKKKTFCSKPAIIKNNTISCEEFCIDQHHLSSQFNYTDGFTGSLCKSGNKLDNCFIWVVLFILLFIVGSLVIGNSFYPEKIALVYIACFVIRPSYFSELLEFLFR